MLNNLSEKRFTVKRMLTPDTEKLIAKAFDAFDLNSVDYYTLLDLLEYSGPTLNEKTANLAAILACLFSALKDGSLCLMLNGALIKNKLDIITGNNNESAQIINNFLSGINEYKKIISINKDEYKPIVLQTLDKNQYLYFQKYYSAGQKLQAVMHKLLDPSNETDISKIDKNIINMINLSPLNEKQKLALFLSLIKNFIVISGGPGTGKTYLIFWVLKALIKYGIDVRLIRLAAPTGRAAERLTESIRKLLQNENDETKKLLNTIEGETIHRLLKYVSYKNDFAYNESNKLPLDVLIVDEVSMVDVNIMTRLLSACKDNAKVILLGDKDQLPSVDAGAVLANLIPQDYEESFSSSIKFINNQITVSKNYSNITDRIIILNKNYRSKGSAHKFAIEINRQNVKIADEIPRLSIEKYLELNFSDDKNCFFIEEEKTDFKNLHFLLSVWLKKYFLTGKVNYPSLIEEVGKTNINKNSQKELLNKIFKIINDTKILSILKEGLFGANTINSIIEELFREKNNKYNKRFFPGMPIMITKNDYILKLFNGDTGVLIKDKNESYNAVFNKNDEFIFIPVNFLKFYESAFSITVHKSQGSEYSNVLLILPDKKESPLLTKELLYTGITRAKEGAVIYGKNDVLKKAVSCRITRESGLDLWKK